MQAGVWKRPINPKRGEIRNCEVCGGEFYRNQSELKKSPRFCSRACHNASQRKDSIIRVCPVCGKTRLLKPSQAHIQTCSWTCAGTLRLKRPLDRLHNGRVAILDQSGYVMVWEPDHPSARNGGWVLEHRLVVEQALGRYLLREEQVDHINGVKDDNRLENLQVLDGTTHAKKTQDDLRKGRQELAEYRRRYGPL
jgi:hypothetical protein